MKKQVDAEVVKLLKIQPCCEMPQMGDLTGGLGEKRNFFCNNCGAHIWDGRLLTRSEWETWVNGDPSLF